MKKNMYIQPEVEVTVITSQSIVCAGSPVLPDLQFGGGGNPNDSETIPG